MKIAGAMLVAWVLGALAGYGWHTEPVRPEPVPVPVPSCGGGPPRPPMVQ